MTLIAKVSGGALMTLALGFSLPASAASLVGDTVSCSRNGVACDGTADATVGKGVEFTRSSTSFDFDAHGVTFTESSEDFGPFSVPLVYSFRDLTNPFTSIRYVSFGSTGLTRKDVKLQDGVLSFTLSGKDFEPGSTARFRLGIDTGAVPEPATWAMMLVGFAMVGAGLRYRRKSTTARFA